MLRTTLLATSFLIAAAVAAPAQSDYPDRPITIIVPYGAGGPTDTVSRLIAESMAKVLGQTLVVENAGGAGSTVGAARVARADADGYTLMINHVAQASSGSLYRKLAFDPDADFDGIGRITDVPMTVVAKADLEPTDIAGYLDYVKKNGETILYGHAGVGSASHLCGMLLMDALDVKMTTVGYKGTGPAMTDLLGGRLDTMCDQTTNTIPNIGSKAIKGYAVTTAARIDALPDLPTLQEAGLPGFEMTVWHGLFAPAGTPPEVLEKLSGALQSALQDPKVIERFAQLGTTPVAIEEATPAAMDAHLAAEITKWQPIIEAAGQFAD
jgi:tripartite-type tricarboxylate transporter receptor subunit TctC